MVTGAGRGIGRAYARLLASLGASVVVNDLGGSMSGKGSDEGPAHSVVNEISEAGGVAVADTNDVASVDGARSLVDGAVERFGRLDALVNNAGIMRWAGPPDVDVETFERHLAVHLVGSFNTALAAWPHMTEQGSGRIVMTASAGVFGLPANTAYAAAKGGTIGLARSLALAGAKVGIAVNVVAPAAMTRMAGPQADEDDPTMNADLVAPMVAFLCHDDCPVNGEIYSAGAGRFARIVIASNDGWVDDDRSPTVDDVAAHWAEINDVTDTWLPTDLTDWSARFLRHLG